MVLQKKLDYGFNGYQVPTMLRVPRSARGKRSARKKVEDNQMCPFDLLATVAGKLLLEKENSSTPTNDIGISNPTIIKNAVKHEQVDEDKAFKAETFDQGSCNESTLQSELVIKNHIDYALKEHSQTLKVSASGPASSIIKSDAVDKDVCAGESIINGSGGEFRYFDTIPKKRGTERHSPGSAESIQGKVEDVIKTPLQTEWRMSNNVMDRNIADMCGLEDPMDLDSKPPALVTSDSSVEVPLCRDHIPRSSSFPNCRDNMELDVDRDDDDKSSGCTQPSTVTSKAFRPQRIGDRRIRKLLASKFWKVAPTILKEGELSNTDVEMKPNFRSRKMCYTRQRTQRCSFKRRRLFERCSISASDGGFSSEGISNAFERGIKVEGSDSGATLHGANGTSSSMTGQKASYKSGDFQVQLSIKSFKVPELFIEIPETATVGSLKRTVMEAVTAILRGGLRVGVHLQGKKVRDDNKTLLQAGISRMDKLDNLGFTLEPNPIQAPAPLTSPEDPHFLLPTEPLNRLPAVTPGSNPGASDASPSEPPLTTPVNCPESDHDSVHSPTDTSSLDKTTTNSRALVAIPAMSVEALAMIPLHRKSRRSELVQRRIRRPFSVSEVEALVHAVEKLGTGRWRDVKIRAFDNAKHRTYVDLKDKWKTLVHTARISPQQRRGEPVPQELLDRVLSAHAYWSQQQAKLQAKPPQADPCLLL